MSGLAPTLISIVLAGALCAGRAQARARMMTWILDRAETTRQDIEGLETRYAVVTREMSQADASERVALEHEISEYHHMVALTSLSEAELIKASELIAKSS